MLGSKYIKTDGYLDESCTHHHAISCVHSLRRITHVPFSAASPPVSSQLFMLWPPTGRIYSDHALNLKKSEGVLGMGNWRPHWQLAPAPMVLHYICQTQKIQSTGRRNAQSWRNMTAPARCPDHPIPDEFQPKFTKLNSVWPFQNSCPNPSIILTSQRGSWCFS